MTRWRGTLCREQQWRASKCLTTSSLPGGNQWFVAFSSFHGVNTPTMAHVSCQHDINQLADLLKLEQPALGSDCKPAKHPTGGQVLQARLRERSNPMYTLGGIRSALWKESWNSFSSERWRQNSVQSYTKKMLRIDSKKITSVQSVEFVDDLHQDCFSLKCSP